MVNFRRLMEFYPQLSQCRWSSADSPRASTVRGYKKYSPSSMSSSNPQRLRRACSESPFLFSGFWILLESKALTLVLAGNPWQLGYSAWCRGYRPADCGIFSCVRYKVLFVAILFIIYGFHAAHYDTMDIRCGLRGVFKRPREAHPHRGSLSIKVIITI